MLHAAQTILTELETSHILEALFHRDPSLTSIPISQSILNRINSQTRLVTTGHSLGAGIASLVSLSLHKRYPNQCYAYGAPGQTLSPRLSQFTKPFITTIFYGDDCIPRFSGYGFVCLKDNIAASLCCCKRSKLGLLLRLFWKRHHRVEDLFYSSMNEIPQAKQVYLQAWIEKVYFHQSINQSINQSFTLSYG